MAKTDCHNLPRIFTPSGLADQALFDPGADAHHHLITVLRAREGDRVRVFNGRDGEWLAHVEGVTKKGCALICEDHLQQQPAPGRECTLVFAPIKKGRMDFLIEKAVELGVTHLKPVLTQNTQTRTLKRERIEKQIVSAAEQCERMDIPELGGIEDLEDVLGSWPDTVPLLACLARLNDTENNPLPTRQEGVGVLIGPEGGFTDEEIARISQLPCVTPISLASHVLRAETAAIAALSRLGPP